MNDLGLDNKKKYQGVPKNPDAPREKSRWRSFLGHFTRKAKKAAELAERAAVAEVEKKEFEAKSAQWAAETDRSGAAKGFFELVDEIEDSNASEEVKLLKMAKLYTMYPEMEKKYTEMLNSRNQLSSKGATIEISVDEAKDKPDNCDNSI